MSHLTHPPGRPPAHRAAAGFSLIEVLVAVFIMGVGVLGIVGLQVLTVQNNRNALYRAEAAQLAYDMMDRIRANADIDNGIDYAPVGMDDALAAPTDCRENVCTPGQMEGYDLVNWKCSLGGFNADDVCQGLDITGFLPQGNGSIALANGMYTITIRWREPNAPADQTFSIESAW